MMNLFMHPQYLIAAPGATEWILILVVILLFFGGKKIPDLMRGLGRGVKEFNDARGGKEKDNKGDASDKQKQEALSDSAGK